MVKNLGDKVVVVFTDRTPAMVKDKLSDRVKDHLESVFIWDSTKETATIGKVNTYESIVQNAQRVILTADLDYATAHALSKK
jgi:mitochondrial fission protein ELM1